MYDKTRDEEIMFLLRIWARLDGGTVWPKVKHFVETRLNEILGQD